MEQTPEHLDVEPPLEPSHESLRGSFFIVMCMAVFFIACWLGMFALLLHRR